VRVDSTSEERVVHFLILAWAEATRLNCGSTPGDLFLSKSAVIPGELIVSAQSQPLKSQADEIN